MKYRLALNGYVVISKNYRTPLKPLKTAVVGFGYRPMQWRRVIAPHRATARKSGVVEQRGHLDRAPPPNAQKLNPYIEGIYQIQNMNSP